MMARAPRETRFDAPRSLRTGVLGRSPHQSRDRFGRFTEWVARKMGTPAFLVALSLFCAVWLAWNTLAPIEMRFDSAANGFTALTLMLSLQASYAAPLILLAQNRQDDRDRVQIEQDRQRAERNLADTEYLAREIVALRMALDGVATRDMLRQELRTLLEDLEERDVAKAAEAAQRTADAADPRNGGDTRHD